MASESLPLKGPAGRHMGVGLVDAWPPQTGSLDRLRGSSSSGSDIGGRTLTCRISAAVVVVLDVSGTKGSHHSLLFLGLVCVGVA